MNAWHSLAGCCRCLDVIRLAAGKKEANVYKAFLIKYGEIGIKGKNRYLFEYALMDQIKFSLRKVEGQFEVTKEQGRVYVEALTEYDYDEVIKALSRVFGIVAICPVVLCDNNEWSNLCQVTGDYMERTYPDQHLSFKVFARRADKSYPKKSMEIGADMGEYLLDRFPDMTVDVHNPDVALNIEVRERTYIYSISIPGPGGMPVGTNGKAMLLLSGGIDSPVAGYMIAKRGVQLEMIHFASPPYTGELAREKVLKLAEELTPWCGRLAVFIIPFTEIQEEIRRKCPEDHFTLIMRRFMMRLANMLALELRCRALVTGENLGQVASQTMQALAVSEDVTTMPVLRPLIGMDKEEIVKIARHIGTFDTSILPYEDCCTVFTPRHPKTKPSVEETREYESALDVEGLCQRAMAGREMIRIKPTL